MLVEHINDSLFANDPPFGLKHWVSRVSVAMQLHQGSFSGALGKTRIFRNARMIVGGAHEP
jgi:hypothetical protein